MIIKDIWGNIDIEDKYQKTIETKEFKELKNKNQLGLNSNKGGIHTRYEHSIGTYYLAKRLIDICKSKFSDILVIKKEDEDAIKLTALLHDLGHGVYSHVSEKHLKGSHETRTIEIITDTKTEVNKAIRENFSKEVLNKIEYLINLKDNIKIENNDEEIDLLFIVKKLLSGGIDIDRIDYIYRDSVHTKGEHNDFSSIIENIDLEFIDNSLEVVFSDKVLYTIANFFNKRFELYDTCYVECETLLIEQVFKRFLESTNTKITWNTTEIEMNEIIKNNLLNKDTCIKRYAEILSKKSMDEYFLLKEFSDKNSYDVFLKQLFETFPILNSIKEVVLTSSAKISIYNKNNKILINKDGIIKDISEISKILNSDLKKEKFIVSIDLVILKELFRKNNIEEQTTNKIIKQINEYFGTKIEMEKKYSFNEESVNPKEEFKLISTNLELENPTYLENKDTYYEDVDCLLDENNISVRKRITNKKEEWTIKRLLEDNTSILKREELNFTSLEQVIYFLINDWNIPVGELKEKITLHTKRVKYDKELCGGLFEIVFDETTSEINGEEQNTNYMVECELKSGKSSGLYFINKVISSYPFIYESNLSKKEIAITSITKNDKIKVKAR